jgi:hypothetical protein
MGFTLHSLIYATTPVITEVTNKPAPRFAPIPICVYPPSTALIRAKTSGPPFPNARKVTPAILGGIPNFSTISVRATQKYLSAVVAKMYMIKASITIQQIGKAIFCHPLATHPSIYLED